MSKDMFNVLIRRIKEEKFKETIAEISFFKELPDNLIRNLLGLNKESFHRYIILIERMQNQHLTNCNFDVLIAISYMIVINMEKTNVNILMHLLATTRIIENLNVVEFSSMLLQIEDENKLETINTVFSKLSTLNIKNIVNYLSIINRCQNKFQMNLLSKIILNNEVRNHKYFNHIVEIFLRNADEFNLIEIEKCLHNSALLKNKNLVYILSNYLLNCNNQQEANLIFKTIMNKEFVNSRSLIKFLDLIKNPKNRKYYKVFISFSNEKTNLSDSVFEYLLDSILKTKNNLQIEAIESLLNYPNILKDELQTTFIVEKYLLITKKYQFIALDRLIENNVYLENFDLLSVDNYKIINAIMKTLDDYKAYCLANSSQYFLNYKYSSLIIEKILNTNNSLICNYITLLLSIENLKEEPNFFQIFDSLLKCLNENQMAAVIEFAKNENIRNSSNYLKLFNIIYHASDKQLEVMLKIVSKFDNFNDEIIFRYLNNILSENNSSKLDILTLLIINHNILGDTKTLDYIALVKNSENKEYKDVLETLRNDFVNSGINEELPKQKKIFKLGAGMK